MTPPVAGADLRTALVASCLRGALPPVDLRAVCLVRAMFPSKKKNVNPIRVGNGPYAQHHHLQPLTYTTLNSHWRTHHDNLTHAMQQHQKTIFPQYFIRMHTFFFFTQQPTTYNQHTSHKVKKKNTKQPTKKQHQQHTLSTILKFQAPRHYTAALLTGYILPEHTWGKCTHSAP